MPELIIGLLTALAFAAVAVIAALAFLKRYRKETQRDEPSGAAQFWGWATVIVASVSYPVFLALGKPAAAIAFALFLGALLQVAAILERAKTKDEHLIERKADRDLLESLGWSIIIAASAGAVIVEFL